jgi:hypothetical protein
MNVSSRTIETLRVSLFEVFGVKSRVGFAVLLVKHQLFDIDDYDYKRIAHAQAE